MPPLSKAMKTTDGCVANLRDMILDAAERTGGIQALLRRAAASIKKEPKVTSPATMSNIQDSFNRARDRYTRERLTQGPGPTYLDSTSDERKINNTVRHQYRVLSADDKMKMTMIKDKGLEFLDLIESLRTSPQAVDDVSSGELGSLYVATFDRELNIAAERVEEAVMWAVKHVTQ